MFSAATNCVPLITKRTYTSHRLTSIHFFADPTSHSTKIANRSREEKQQIMNIPKATRIWD